MNELRQKSFDCVFLGVDGDRQQEGVQLMEHLRTFDRPTELMVVTSGRAAKDLAGMRGRFGIAGFVQTPIEITDFFRAVARFRERRMGNPAETAAT